MTFKVTRYADENIRSEKNVVLIAERSHASLLKGAGQAPPTESSPNEGVLGNQPMLICHTCGDMKFSGEKQMHEHMIGKRHLERTRLEALAIARAT